MIRNIYASIAVAAASAALLAGGCGSRPPQAPQANVRLRVLASTFPMYLFTRHVAQGREGVRVEPMLPGSMGCPHDYVLTPDDMRKIASADVFVANGLGMEEFLGAPLSKANPRIKVIDSSKGITGTLRLAGDDEEARHHGGTNPHLFASPRMAAQVVRNIAAELAAADPAGAEFYRRNADGYAARLDGVAGEFAAAAGTFRARKIVTQHAVFDYLARDAGLGIVAVVEEVPGQEPSAAQMLEIVRRIKSSGAAALFTEPQYPAKVGERIAEEAGIPVASLDPVASGPDDPPMDYYEQVMRKNLDVLKRVLGNSRDR